MWGGKQAPRAGMKQQLSLLWAGELGAAPGPLLKENICTRVKREEGIKVSTCFFSATPVIPQ